MIDTQVHTYSQYKMRKRIRFKIVKIKRNAIQLQKYTNTGIEYKKEKKRKCKVQNKK